MLNGSRHTSGIAIVLSYATTKTLIGVIQWGFFRACLSQTMREEGGCIIGGMYVYEDVYCEVEPWR